MQGDVSNNKARNRAALDGDKKTTLADTEKQSLRRSRRLSSVVFTNQDRNLIIKDETKAALAPTKTDATATNTNINTDRVYKKDIGGNFDFESALLEPRPKRNRNKSTKRAAKKQKREAKVVEEKEKKNVVMHESKMQTPDAVLSVLPSSTSALNSSSHRCLDPVIASDDDHCLPRKREGPFDASKFTSGIATYDKASEGNVGEVPAYVTDIFQRLFDAEVRAINVFDNFPADLFGGYD